MIVRIILKQTFRSFYAFSQDNNKTQQKPYMSLKNLKEAVDRQHFFVRKNFEEIGHQLIQNIEKNKWGLVKKMLLIININELDSWLLLRCISKTLNTSCNNIKIADMNKEQLGDLLSVLVLLRFEPKRMKVDSFKGRPSQFDDSTNFVNELEKHIKEVSLQREESYFFELARRLLHTNPALFLTRRQEIQKKILDRIEIFMESKSLLNELLVRGCISQFWTKDFKAEMLKRNLPDNYVKALTFQDIQIPTKVQKINQENNLKTQGQIMNILQGFGYPVQQNLLVNGYEVDFIIANKLIVEYNGHHHYIINSKKLIPTAKDRWKQSVLQKRNFAISSIPYSEWKPLKLFEEKRKYLVTKIENDWLRHFKYTRQEIK